MIRTDFFILRLFPANRAAFTLALLGQTHYTTSTLPLLLRLTPPSRGVLKHKEFPSICRGKLGQLHYTTVSGQSPLASLRLLGKHSISSVLPIELRLRLLSWARPYKYGARLLREFPSRDSSSLRALPVPMATQEVGSSAILT